MIRFTLIVALVSFAVCYLATPACRVAADRLACVAMVRERDTHAIPVPYLGGVALFLALWSGLAVAAAAPMDELLGPIALLDATHVMVAVTILFVYGLADDLFDLAPLYKFLAQVATGCLLAMWGVALVHIPLPGGELLILDDTQSGVLTVVFTVLAANAVNFVDGLDGLAAGVVASGAGGLMIVSSHSLNSHSPSALGAGVIILSATLIGALLGFYMHNRHPALIFMGDAGSLMLGGVLAAAVILSMQLYPAYASDAQGVGAGSVSRVGTYLWICLPAAIVGIPALDLVLAVIRRVRRGQSILQADREHLHHRLLGRGGSHGHAVNAITAWAAILSCGGAWIVASPSVTKMLAVGSLAAVVLAWHEWTARRSAPRVPLTSRIG